MAPTNLDVVRSISAPWQTGDFSSPPDWAHPEIEWVIADGPMPGRWSGVAGMVEGWRDFLSAWEEWRVEADEFRELDGERVLALFQFSARGKASGLEVGEIRTKGAGLYHVRDGKVTKLVLYWDRERALDDLGIAPEGGRLGS
jgi:ketosteroid isomerase-like protein